MLNKLAFRNAKRSVKDYLVYLLTMTALTALMFSFNAMLFSKDIQEMCESAGIMAAMIGLATFFIVMIFAWLIHYMMRFMLEKRSREFGIYLLLGMEKEKIASLYKKENLIMGGIGFLTGLLAGIFLKQILLSVFYNVMGKTFHLDMRIGKACILMTFGCYAGCYLLSFIRCGRYFSKMSIRRLMDAERENEQVKQGGEGWKQWLFFSAFILFFIFNLYLFTGGAEVGIIMILLLLLGISIYLMYMGLSAFLVRYIKKGGSLMYKGSGLFLLRQLSGKLQTMRFTMGNLTVIFTFALLGCTLAMMFTDFQNRQLEKNYPFDVIIYNRNASYDFTKERKLIEEEAIEKSLAYRIYQNGTKQMNIYLSTHLHGFGDTYINPDGTAKEELIGRDTNVYYSWDTFMKLSDYNYLREMSGYEKVELPDDGYCIQIKERLIKELDASLKDMTIEGSYGTLHLDNIYSEDFCQSGHNGADYVIVVPDREAESMKPYYSVFAANVKNGSTELYEKLTGGQSLMEKLYSEWDDGIRIGSDQIISYAGDILVKTEVMDEMRFMISSITFPLFYMGLVFLCVALTILSVQQLSDSAKYKHRYGILGKLGLEEAQINRTVLKQLLGYYMCPVLVSVVLSAASALYVSDRFIFYTGVKTPVIYYYGMSLLILFGVYALYFTVTYIGFKRNLKEN